MNPCNDYFWHPAYNDYPVVGVTWKQAKAFAAWRTLYKNAYQKEKASDLYSSFRLPMEGEWEYAARGGLASGNYPGVVLIPSMTGVVLWLISNLLEEIMPLTKHSIL